MKTAALLAVRFALIVSHLANDSPGAFSPSWMGLLRRNGTFPPTYLPVSRGLVPSGAMGTADR